MSLLCWCNNTAYVNLNVNVNVSLATHVCKTQLTRNFNSDINTV